MASVWSLPEMINTPPGRPLAPKKIDVRNIGTDSCSLSWSVGLCVAGGSVSRYEIQLTEVGYYDHKTESEPVCADDSDERVQFKDGLRSAREATLENLLSGRTYKVHLRTVNSGNEESGWNWTEFQTLADAPSVPESPSVTSVQSDAVAIEWREPVSNGSPITGKIRQKRSVLNYIFRILRPNQERRQNAFIKRQFDETWANWTRRKYSFRLQSRRY